MIKVLGRVFGAKSSKKRLRTDPVMRPFARVLVPKDPELTEKFSFGVRGLARRVCKPRESTYDAHPVRDLYSRSTKQRRP
jgi:adenine-specific DNA glycosylase